MVSLSDQSIRHAFDIQWHRLYRYYNVPHLRTALRPVKSPLLLSVSQQAVRGILGHRCVLYCSVSDIPDPICRLECDGDRDGTPEETVDDHNSVRQYLDGRETSGSQREA